MTNLISDPILAIIITGVQSLGSNMAFNGWIIQPTEVKREKYNIINFRYVYDAGGSTRCWSVKICEHEHMLPIIEIYRLVFGVILRVVHLNISVITRTKLMCSCSHNRALPCTL